MKENIPLKYACLDRFDEIYNNGDTETLRLLLKELRNLIFYQMNEIKDQRMEIISSKHKEAWKQYDNK